MTDEYQKSGRGERQKIVRQRISEDPIHAEKIIRNDTTLTGPEKTRLLREYKISVTPGRRRSGNRQKAEELLRAGLTTSEAARQSGYSSHRTRMLAHDLEQTGVPITRRATGGQPARPEREQAEDALLQGQTVKETAEQTRYSIPHIHSLARELRQKGFRIQKGKRTKKEKPPQQ